MEIYKKKLYFWIKVLISLGLMSFLLLKFDFQSLVDRFLLLNLWWFLLFFLLPHVNIVLSTWKWKILLRSNDVDENFSKLIKLYLIGTFFSNFLPTMAGGDVVRVAQLSMKTGKTASVVAATYIERLSGVTALLFFLCAILFDRELAARVPVLPFAICFFALGYIILIVVSFNRRLYCFLSKKIQGRYYRKIFSIIDNIQEAVFHYHNKTIVLIKALIISIIFYFLACISVYFAGKALLVEIPLLSVFIVVPLVIMVGMLPVTLNGLGLNESSYVFFFALFGVSAPMALSIALVLRFRILFTAMLGGGIFAFERTEHRPSCVKSD